MSNEQYNGWTNYETWSWALWIGNDQGWHESTTEAALQLVRDYDGNEDDARISLAEYLEAECGEMQDGAGLDSGPLADLLGSAISQIDWRSIAEHYVWDALSDWQEEQDA